MCIRTLEVRTASEDGAVILYVFNFLSTPVCLIIFCSCNFSGVFFLADLIVLVLVFLLLLVALVCFFLFKKNQWLEQRVSTVLHEKSSQSVKYGKTSEQFMPFMESMPFSHQNFRFLGNPIDGIAFEENEIIFCEFKTGSSVLSEKQKKIKQLVEDKKIKWLETKI